MTIRAVFFDLDGTLLRDDRMSSVIEAVAFDLARTHPQLRVRTLLARQHQVWQEHWDEAGEDWLLGRIPADAVTREVWRRTLASLGVDDPAVVERAVAMHMAAEEESHTLYEESADVLAALRERGLLLGLITNGASDLQRAKIRAAGIEDAFDTVLVSGELGVLKPTEEIFQQGLRRLDVAASEALHVGDNLESDVAGARGAGLRAVWVDRRCTRHVVPGASMADAIVSDLNGLLPLLE
ncbi:HAD family hydrolase [Microbacter sp. GSS18]|nr:HAD family hydrolase [Microbacter sp. GSS18]